MATKPMMNPVVLLNGPPGAGKNFLAAMAMEHFIASDFALSSPAKRAALAAYSLDEMGYTLEQMELDKNRPRETLNGKSWREAVIMLTETFNAMYGWEHWANVTINKILIFDKEMARIGSNAIIFVTDMCSPGHISAFEKAMPDRCILMRIHRPDTSFKKYPGYEEAYGQGTGEDSRNWLFSDVITSVDIINNGSSNQYFQDFIFNLAHHFSLKRFMRDRNNKLIQGALVRRNPHFMFTEPFPQFEKPYKVYWPKLFDGEYGPIAKGKPEETNA